LCQDKSRTAEKTCRGRRGIPTIGFGPQHEIYAHTVDEFVPVDALIKATTFYAAIPQMILETTRSR
jgi:acetylornithine deacetylase/succinyl-diaminopimelate desuccinylase-like protein